MRMTRYTATAIHFSISLVVAVVVMAVMFLVWYPGGYFALMGGGVLLVLIVGVDVCLGPLITSIIYKPGKKGLRFDLTVIGILQFGALMYGVHTLYVARPVFTVFVENSHFRVAPANGIREQQFALAAREEWKQASLSGPVLIASETPSDPQEKSDLVFSSAFGEDIHQIPKYFRTYDEKRSEIVKAAKPLVALLEYDPENRPAVARFVQKKSGKLDDYSYLPIRADKDFMVAVLDRRTGTFLDIIDAKPRPPVFGDSSK